MGLSPAKLFPLRKRTESTAIAKDQQVTILTLTLCVTLEKLSGCLHLLLSVWCLDNSNLGSVLKPGIIPH